MSEQEEIKTEEEVFKIPPESLFPDFQEHIEPKNNNRIIFSGKFGIGKTTFLIDFFKANKDKYEVFHLFPVNYQITSNENVIDFLKYDILLELLKKNREIFKNNKTKGIKKNISLVANFLKQRGLKKNLKSIIASGENILDIVGAPFGISLGKLGKSLKDILDFDEELQAFKKEIEKGDKGIIEDYIKEIRGNKNNTESDIISEILKRKIAEQKAEQKKEKESVLILDDLERIDPEHVFRILNVFSAHLCPDHPLKENIPNKFGFDKIILVADIGNLRSIFHHKYGDNTDSRGYFDKFYSSEIFEFKNERIIKESIAEIIHYYDNVVDNKKLKGALNIRDGRIGLFLEMIIRHSIDLDILSLRELIKGTNVPLKSLSEKRKITGRGFSLWDPWLFISIEALISIFGGVNSDFIKVINKIREKVRKENIDKRLFNEWSFCLLSNIVKWDEGNMRYKDFSLTIDNEKISGATWINPNNEKIRLDPYKELFFDLIVDWVKNKK